jgi:hypothetical protein
VRPAATDATDRDAAGLDLPTFDCGPFAREVHAAYQVTSRRPDEAEARALVDGARALARLGRAGRALTLLDRALESDGAAAGVRDDAKCEQADVFIGQGRWAEALAAVAAVREGGGRAAALRAQAEELASRQTDLSAAVRRNGTDLATLGGRIEDSQQAVTRLSDTVEGGRTRLQLAAVEQLLLLANDRLLLAHDSGTALKALDLADLLGDAQLERAVPLRQLGEQPPLLVAQALLFETGPDPRAEQDGIEGLRQVILGAQLDAPRDGLDLLQ